MIKKLIIGANEVTEVIYENINVKAQGGKRKKLNSYYVKKDKHFVGIKLTQIDSRLEEWDDIYRDKYLEQSISDYSNENIFGKYHVKNYIQRLKKRIKEVNQLIKDNFKSGSCSMITLSFKENIDDIINNEKLEASKNINNEDYFLNEYGETDLLKISNYFFSSDHGIGDTDINLGTEIKTIGEKYIELKTCNNEFKKFIQKMNYRYENFKYVAVMGKQDNGNWHYHMICNINFIEFNELKRIWGKGGVYITSIKDDTLLLIEQNYLIKNMRVASIGLKGVKGYLASKRLNRRKELRSWVSKEKAEFEEQNYKLEQAKNLGIKYINKYIAEHHYTSPTWTTEDGTFYEEGEKENCKRVCKYYTYPIKLKQFKLLNIAKKRRIKKRGQHK